MHERLEFNVVVKVVGVADAHEEEVRRQTRHHVDHHAFGLQVCEHSTNEEEGSARNMKHMVLPWTSGADASTQDDVLNEPGLVLPLVLQHAEVVFGNDASRRLLGYGNEELVLSVKN